MTAVFCQPRLITYHSSSTAITAPAKNLTLDEPGMVWRSSGLSGAFVTFALDGAPIDTIALVGTNLRASDTVRIRMGATAAEVASVAPFDRTFSAWSGIAPLEDAICAFLLDAPVAYQFIRVDFYAPSHPVGYVEACRLVVGSRIENKGIDIGHEEGFDDTSSVDEGLGYTTIDRYNVRQAHKLTISHVKEDDYYAKWQPFLKSVGQSKFFLYMESTTGDYIQRKIGYVRISSQAKRVNRSYDFQVIDMSVVTYK